MKLPRSLSEIRARARNLLQKQESQLAGEPEPQAAPSPADFSMPQAVAADDWPLAAPEDAPRGSRIAARALRILLFVLIGMPLLVGVVLLIFALYLVVWALIVAAYLLVFAMLLGTLALFVLSILRFGGNAASGIFLFGGGLVTASLAALLLLGVNAFTPLPTHAVLKVYPKLQKLVLLAWKGGADA